MSAFGTKRTWRANVAFSYFRRTPRHRAFFSFCWAVFFFGGGFTNRLKQLSAHPLKDSLPLSWMEQDLTIANLATTF
jgi:hypothetical protein